MPDHLKCFITFFVFLNAKHSSFKVDPHHMVSKMNPENGPSSLSQLDNSY